MRKLTATERVWAYQALKFTTLYLIAKALIRAAGR